MAKRLTSLLVMCLLLGACAADRPTGGSEPSVITVRDLMSGGTRQVTGIDWDEINSHPLGAMGNPVRGYMPVGERAYLSRLRCPDRQLPSFERSGSFGAGPFTTIIDGYHVTCSDGKHMIFMDMYHPDYVEQRPVPGFSIVR